MIDAPETLYARRTWVETYRQTGDASLTCRRCGISRPTLRKWARRFMAEGEAGLRSQSRRPHRLAESKRTPELTERVLTIRRERNLGAKRIQNELLRLDNVKLSTSTLHRILADAEVKPLKRPKRPRKPKRYSRPRAGDRVQVDSIKVAKGLIQFTAIADCTRMRVLGLYPDKTGIPTRRVSRQDGYPDKTGIPTRRVSRQDGYPDKTGIPTRRACQSVYSNSAGWREQPAPPLRGARRAPSKTREEREAVASGDERNAGGVVRSRSQPLGIV